MNKFIILLVSVLATASSASAQDFGAVFVRPVDSEYAQYRGHFVVLDENTELGESWCQYTNPDTTYYLHLTFSQNDHKLVTRDSIGGKEVFFFTKQVQEKASEIQHWYANRANDVLIVYIEKLF